MTHPLSQPQIEAFDDVLWLSEWQREQWMSTDPKFARFTHIFGNGINPEQFPPVQERKNPFSCIYGSNYGRGLTILVEIWPEIKKLFPQATLDIYYGWKHWGALFPDEENMLRQKILPLSDVKEHGRVSHEDLHQAYAQASLWTYPCTKPEVFCITAIKAQYSGAVPVVLKSAALHETVPYGFSCFQVEEYFETLKTAMEHAEKISVSERFKMRDFILNRWTWKKIADQYIDSLV